MLVAIVLSGAVTISGLIENPYHILINVKSFSYTVIYQTKMQIFISNFSYEDLLHFSVLYHYKLDFGQTSHLRCYLGDLVLAD